MDNFSYISNADPVVIESYYQIYKENPSDLDISWQKFFQGFDFAIYGKTGDSSPETKNLNKEFHVAQLIEAYRSRGHLLSDTNPIRPRKDRDPGVALHYHNLDESDLEKQFAAGILIDLPNAKLKDIIEKLKAIYCRSIAFEYMHIRDTEMRIWCKNKFEKEAHNYDYPIEKKKRILEKINEAVVFENFLHRKYVGQKRFSLEGGENTIPALDAIINKGSELGVRRFAIGMAHRGRLNVLANILGKTYEYIFNEFEGNTYEDVAFGDGDVKYHLGFSSFLKAQNNEDVYLSLVPNPSHLEAVGAVVEGYVRGKGDLLYDRDFKQIMPIIIHGDAAVSGQGIVYEIAQMSQLEGYKTGGTLHFVINNQIGFTTDFHDARSSDYSTAVAQVIDAPVLHVNGDDAEAIVFAVEFATEFRQKFGRDVYVDMLCYRKHGHNESDEPKFTQPDLYSKISKHPNPREVYKNKLFEQGEIQQELAKKMEQEFKNLLQDRLDLVKQKPLPAPEDKRSPQWKNFKKGTAEDFTKTYKTKVSKTALNKVIKAITTIPDEINPIKKSRKVLDDRAKLYKENSIDWALAEMLAYGSILLEGKNIRISGQDAIRGTFSHRHAMMIDENSNTGAGYVNLNHIQEKQGNFDIYNSFLSEYAVLGFEYGYSTASPNVLTIWEAQFGDFANGAQVMMDQFLSSGESKWKRMSGLVLLLPHGYEGQGPEHSNARPERFLQLSAEYNMIVANCTTPANFFHLLRRQITWDFRKPLVVMSPKSLLRYPACRSKIEDLTTGNFQEMIDDDYATKSKVKRVLMCTGKIYYDLLEKQQEDKRKDVAIVRWEQIYPMPEKQLNEIYTKYKKAEFFWVQEEPKNMGAWTYMFRYEKNRQHLKLISRKSSASPATGYAKVHEQEQNHIVDQAFGEG